MEQVLDIAEMKHEHETNVGMTFMNTKRRRIKLVEKLSIMAKLGKVIFLGCIHRSIWALDIQEEAWPRRWVLHR
jgi:hypothetical protein